jgi:tungstate transport system substrate-binding protein
MLISKEKCPSVKSKEGQLFIDWLISDKGQKIIGQFTINERRVFNPHSD